MTRSSRARLRLGAALLVAAFVCGCSQRVADLTLISTKNIDLSNVSLDAREGNRVTGKHCVYWPLGLIPFGLPNLEEAIDDALEKGGGNVMVDQVTYQSGLYFIIASQQCIEAEGTVLSTAR